MNKSASIIAAAAALLICAGAAPAQTPANVAAVSGNGQLICQCQWGGPAEFFFKAMVVRVTDATGAPISGTQVTWAVTSGGYGGSLTSTQTSTDVNGISTNFFTPGPIPAGSPGYNFQQTTIAVTSGSASVNFTLTQGAQTPLGQIGGGLTPFVFFNATGGREIFAGTTVSGQIGQTVSPPIKIAVVTAQFNQPMPNIAVMIQNDQTPDVGPVLSCATQAGAGTNLVLTDATGVATCNPVFSGVPNVNGTARVIVGGALPVDAAGKAGVSCAVETPNCIGQFAATNTFVLRATPGAPGQIRVVSGNNQSAQAGQALASPLTVEVVSSTGSPMAGQNVNWTVAPASAASLGSAQTQTDSSGRTSNTLRFALSTSGPVQVTATLANDTTKSVSFTATAVPNVTVTGLQIVSGNNQSAIINTAFAQPLVVQLNATGGAASGVAVTFTISGPATLSGATATTGANGQAQVNVTAGSTAGAVTVTASAAGFSQTFNLIVSPPGPTLLTSSFVNAADLQRGALSPCSLATIIATGIAPGLQGMVNASPLGLLPGNLANTRVTVGGVGAPISSVGRNAGGQETLTFQVPCEVNPGTVPVVVNVGAGSATINIPIQTVSPGIFSQFGTDGVNRAVVIRPEGSFVGATPAGAARPGEILTALVTGLGPSVPVVSTNSVAPPGSITSPQGTVVVGMAGRGIPLISAQLSPDLIGVWLVQFMVPSDINSGDAVFSISVIPPGSSSPVSSGTAVIPIQR